MLNMAVTHRVCSPGAPGHTLRFYS